MTHHRINRGELPPSLYLDLPSASDDDKAPAISRRSALKSITNTVGRDRERAAKRRGVYAGASRTEYYETPRRSNLGGRAISAERTAPQAGRTAPTIPLLGGSPGERTSADLLRRQLGRHLDSPSGMGGTTYAEDFGESTYDDDGAYGNGDIYSDDARSYNSYELFDRLAGDTGGSFYDRADAAPRLRPRRPGPFHFRQLKPMGDDVMELARANAAAAYERTLLRYGYREDRGLYRRSKKMMRSEAGRTFESSLAPPPAPPGIDPALLPSPWDAAPVRRENVAVQRLRPRASPTRDHFTPIWEGPMEGNNVPPTPLSRPVPVRGTAYADARHRDSTQHPQQTPREGAFHAVRGPSVSPGLAVGGGASPIRLNYSPDGRVRSPGFERSFGPEGDTVVGSYRDDGRTGVCDGTATDNEAAPAGGGMSSLCISPIREEESLRELDVATIIEEGDLTVTDEGSHSELNRTLQFDMDDEFGDATAASVTLVKKYDGQDTEADGPSEMAPIDVGDAMEESVASPCLESQGVTYQPDSTAGEDAGDDAGDAMEESVSSPGREPQCATDRKAAEDEDASSDGPDGAAAGGAAAPSSSEPREGPVTISECVTVEVATLRLRQTGEGATRNAGDIAERPVGASTEGGIDATDGRVNISQEKKVTWKDQSGVVREDGPAADASGNHTPDVGSISIHDGDGDMPSDRPDGAPSEFRPEVAASQERNVSGTEDCGNGSDIQLECEGVEEIGEEGEMAGPDVPEEYGGGGEGDDVDDSRESHRDDDQHGDGEDAQQGNQDNDLPSGWFRKFSRTKQVHYFCHLAHGSTWTHPGDIDAESGPDSETEEHTASCAEESDPTAEGSVCISQDSGGDDGTRETFEAACDDDDDCWRRGECAHCGRGPVDPLPVHKVRGDMCVCSLQGLH